MLSRLVPPVIDNTYRGQWLGLVLFVLFLALKLIMSVNSILNTEAVAVGADGIPLESYGAEAAAEVVSLFRLLAWSQFMLVVWGLIALVRYRALVPLTILVLLTEHLGRRVLIAVNATEPPDGVTIGFYINLALSIVLLLGLALSLWTRRAHRNGGRW